LSKKTSKHANAVLEQFPNGPNNALFEKRLAVAIDLHNEAVAGKKGAVGESHRAFEKLRSDHPGHPIADAFHGSVMSLIARDESNPLTRLQWAKRGLKLLDEAVASDSSDSRIRMLRGKVAYRLPEQFFHRTQTAIEDFLVLIDGELRDPGSVPKETYDKLIYELGDAYHRIDRPQEAKFCWSKLLKQTNEPKYRKLIKQQMQSAEAVND
jgi:hypothetical protein